MGLAGRQSWVIDSAYGPLGGAFTFTDEFGELALRLRCRAEPDSSPGDGSRGFTKYSIYAQKISGGSYWIRTSDQLVKSSHLKT